MTPQDTGERIGGRYALRETLGSGGMGVVWRAHDELLQRDVAIKEVRFPSNLPQDQRGSISKRVMREARASASLNHPSAVAVFDVIQGEGKAFIVMELIDAPTLADMAKTERFTPQRVAEIGLQVLSALEAAHAQGIVHRDVKPANVMIPENGQAKLADFGIASVKGDPRLTASGMILGSPHYMSPEQARGSEATTASDIWALGATLFYAAEGRVPFDKGQPIPTLTAVLTEEPTFSERSGELRPVLEACLSKETSQRPNASQLRGMLESVAAGQVIATPPTEERTSEVVASPQTERKRTAALPVRKKSSGPLWLLGLAALVLAGVVLILVNLPADERSPEPRAQQDGRKADEGTPTQREVPEGYTVYENPDAGYSIAHPEDWSIEEGRGTDQSIDFVDPDTGAYMRVDWTDTPGPSAQGAWEAQEPSFEAEHPNYERISMEPTTFQGFEASEWEYTWGDETTYHAINLGFVTGEYGFALNYQAPEDSWNAVLDDFEAMRDSFTAP
ncbi:MAG: serine/threonine-protein kinase [Actinomycetota bacterium]